MIDEENGMNDNDIVAPTLSPEVLEAHAGLTGAFDVKTGAFYASATTLDALRTVMTGQPVTWFAYGIPTADDMKTASNV